MDKYNILKMKTMQNTNFAVRANINLKISKNTNDDTIDQIQKSLSTRKDKLAEILNSKTFQPLFIDTNGTSPSIGTSSNICDENMQPQSNNEVGPSQHRAVNGMENSTPPSIVSHISAMNVNPRTPQNHYMLARLHRDLDSPSAATRLRAMRALKSPENGPYNQFDVPHEEQDIITEEERQEYVPQTIQDVMKDVIVYVEVRFGDENRSSSIKEAIAELGATVNDNFNKNTTHVIFSNGTQSTYNKAKQLNIPIVSILWIEACKKQLRLVDPVKFSIHNVEQYEHPELYKKVKVKKFFQTENELKIKKKKAAAPAVMKFKPIKIPKKAKDNITGMWNEFRERQVHNSNGIDYFSENFNVVDLFNDNTTKSTVGTSAAVKSKKSLNFDAHVSVSASIADTISSPLHLNGTKVNNDNVSQAVEKLPQVRRNESPVVFKTPSNRKTMLANSLGVEQSPNSLVRVTRRTSMMALSSPAVDSTAVQRNRQVMPEEITEISNSHDNQTNNDSQAMEITPNTVSAPRMISNRRTIFSSSAMDITDPQPVLTSTRKRNSIIPARYKDFEVNTTKYLGKNSTTNSESEKTIRRKTLLPYSAMPSSSSTVAILNQTADAKKSPVNRRRTLNTVKQTTVNAANSSALNAIHEDEKPSSNRRKTLFAPNEASSPLVGNKNGEHNIANLRRTLFQSSDATMSPLAITPVAKVDDAKATNSKRRRTLLPPNDKASSSLIVSTLKKAVEISGTSSSRRRTEFTPNSHGSSSMSRTSPLKKTNDIMHRRRTNFEYSHITGDQPTPIIKDKRNDGSDGNAQTPVTSGAERNPNTSSDCLTPQSHTLFEEYSRNLSFSSTNKRHTDRDISLFIIEQRLKNINEIARLNRSVSESDVNNVDMKKRISDKVARSTPQLPAPEKVNNAKEDVQPPPPKRRKLFNPNAYEEEMAMKTTMDASASDNNNKPTAGPVDKPLKQKTKIPNSTPHGKRCKQRRTTMDFKTEPPKPVKVYASIMKSNSPMNYLAYSNMNQDRVNVINEAIATLGKFKLESNVTKKTTHLVTFDSKRTQKFLRAIIRGLWIINYDWITASLQARNWLYEEPFENRSVSSAVSVCRAEAQAFGSKYQIEIFGHIEPIYISTKCKCPALGELYKMCGGRVTNNRSTAKYVIADRLKDNVKKLCLHSDWILDSITAATCKSVSSYILKLQSSVPV